MGITEGEPVPLIGPGSPLRCIPVELNQDQSRLLNGLRLNAHAAARSWERLITEIGVVSNGHRNGIDIPSAMADAWAMVDAFDLVVRIAEILKGSASPNLSPYKAEFRKVRNDHQHREERLRTPGHADKLDFGSLHWVDVESPTRSWKYALWPGQASGRQIDGMNPLRHPRTRLGIQSVELDSFSGTARLFDGALALEKFIRMFEASLTEQWEGLERSPADLLVSLEFGSDDDFDPTGNSQALDSQ